MEDALTITGLCKRYAGGFALRDVSFTVPRGYIMGLIGPNGAGKTTVIKLIMNLIRREAGHIQVYGLETTEHEAEAKSRIGYVSDEPHYYDDVKLRDTASAYAGFYKRWDRELFESLAREFELPLSKTFKRLSQGMRIKFSLAMAFAHHPDLLVMDEPTTGLDPVFRERLLDRLSEFISDGERSVLFSTHITADLEEKADFVTFINRGKVMFSQPLDQVHENYAVVKGGEELLEGGRGELLSGVHRGQYGIEALTSRAGLLRQSMTQAAIIERASLEDIMYFAKKEEDSDLQNHSE